MAGGLVASVRAAQTQTACHNLPCFVAGGVFPGGHGRGGGASTCAFGCAAGAGARADGLRIGPSVAGGLVVSVGAAQTRAACPAAARFVRGCVFAGAEGCGGGASTCAAGTRICAEQRRVGWWRGKGNRRGRWLVSRGSGLGHGGIASGGAQGTWWAEGSACGPVQPPTAAAGTRICAHRHGEGTRGDGTFGASAVGSAAEE